MLRYSLLLVFWGSLVAPAPVPQVLGEDVDSEQALSPGQPYRATVAVGEAKFLRFSCRGGPADAIVTLTSYSDNADPLLFLSASPDKRPSFSSHHGSTFAHWKEDYSGDHYARVKGLGPRGGVIGLLNMRKFASEDLDAVLTLQCTYILAFDTLFWDHLRSSALCPMGNARDRGSESQDGVDNSFCSGHGSCDRFGACKCFSDHTGPACEHRKYDIVVGQDFDFQVAAGHYQYFRVHVPPHFVGGYVEVQVQSTAPLIVLIRNDDLPTKSSFDISNFDEWINNRNMTDLKFKVPPSDGIAGVSMAGAGAYSFKEPVHGGPYDADGMRDDALDSSADTQRFPIPGMGMPPPGLEGQGRRLKQLMKRAKEAKSWPDFFRRTQGVRSEVNADGSLGRQLQDDAITGHVPAQCPKLVPVLTHALCKTSEFKQCQDSCMQCLNCVQSSTDEMACSASCQACIQPQCTRALAGCASDVSCAGPEAQRCEVNCGSCMACFDSNDRRCALCTCCAGCLPLSAKCIGQSASESRYVFVGVYHHRRYSSQSRGVIVAKADVGLTADENFVRQDDVELAQKSWIAALYDTFNDMKNVEIANSEDYPSGQQFMYDLALSHLEKLHLQVRVYRDRMTLLHLKNVRDFENMELEFLAGPDISHVLISSKAAPKTLFDFDKTIPKGEDNIVVIQGSGQPSMWCAIFGSDDGWAQISAKTSGGGGPDSMNFSFALVLVFGVICGLLILAAISGGLQKLSDAMSQPRMPLTERLANLVRRPNESTASLTRVGSLQGYSGSDVIDRNVEDQYLHRGGLGDEGL
eukprot:CAMPEP_0197641408 /NCGR_PEP_ID=MMETSP1338-20131121/15391_1 /TAXON_ID=43686 ORGANISM="Pelagodinium beii, Strain RCC1491" /NCGR_SAMPLE_ID=MMETSP1338 /ASSEMBLY_ACC=CAM_ASM_000754 /LENGTH=804 /DNA_ID=CAMNT_0043214389 /DNA_START=8 /DNA_END=2422 /DNA_ORIENTATION=+